MSATKIPAWALLVVLLAGGFIGYTLGYASAQGDCGFFHEYQAVRR